MASWTFAALAILALATGAVASPFLTLNVTSGLSDGDWVGVSVSGVPNPTVQDAVGLYLGANPDFTVVPVKYQWIANSPGYLQTGNGSTSFQVLNMRDVVSFVLFNNLTQATPFNTSNIALSSGVTFANLNEPLHGHLSLTGVEGEMTVSWQTTDAGTPTVKYGTTSGKYTQSTTGSNNTFTPADLCGSPANNTGFRNPGAVNHVTLTGLEPATRYYYVYGDPAFGFSNESTFLTSEPVGADSRLDFLIIADLGHIQVDGAIEYDYWESDDYLNWQATGPIVDFIDAEAVITYYENLLIDNIVQQGSSAHTVDALIENLDNCTLFFLQGDISYARGELSQWDAFWHQMTPLSSNVPLMVQLGNHERDFPGSGDRYDNTAIDSGGECGVPTNTFFPMPYGNDTYQLDNGKEHKVEWYSFDQGPVHFIQISTEVPFNEGSPQNEFVLADLQAVNRSVTPWVIVSGHRPIYSAQTGGSLTVTNNNQVATDLREAFEKMFYAYNVDMTTWGHVHTYYRTCPVLDNTCLGYNATDGTANGPINICLGNSGYSLTFLAMPNYPPYYDVFALEHGFMKCSATGTTLNCTMTSSMSGMVLDNFVLTKPAGWQPDVTGRTAYLDDVFVSNYTGSTIVEVDGIVEGATTGGPAFDALFLAVNTQAEIINALRAAQNATQALTHAVNGADTVVDIWAMLEPTYEVLVELAASNTTGAAAAAYTTDVIIPLFESLRTGSDMYDSMSGLLYRSSRVGDYFSALPLNTASS